VQCAAVNVLYATGTTDPSAQFRVEIDGAIVATQTYGAASVQWQQSFPASWAFGKRVLVVRNLSVSQTMQLEGFTRVKQVRVANQGIIGTASWEWTGTGTLLPGAVRANDTHAFVMLGTNDRGSANSTYPVNVSRTKTAQRSALRYLRDTRGLGVVLVAEIAGAESQEFPTDGTKAYSMQDVRQAIIELGREEGVSVIDLYANTRLRVIKGDAFLADGLHPNEEGFDGMFNDTLSLITEVSL
jgi:lysophospholipase L1-like esterase